KVAEEGAVASGVRRIEAVAGTAAVEAVARRERVLREIADILKIGAEEAPQRLRKLLDEQKALERQLAEMETKLARGKADDLVASARQVNGVAVVAGRIDGLDADGLRAVADTLRDRLGSGVVCVGSVLDGRVNLVAASGTTAVMRDVMGSPDLLPSAHEAVRRDRIRGFVCVPIHARGRMLGTLSLGRQTDDPFDEGEVTLLEATAQQIAIALDNA